MFRSVEGNSDVVEKAAQASGPAFRFGICLDDLAFTLGLLGALEGFRGCAIGLARRPLILLSANLELIVPVSSGAGGGTPNAPSQESQLDICYCGGRRSR